MKKGTTGEVHQHIDAPPEVVYDLVADVTRMGEWSPECTRGEWLNGATGPAVGARFKGSNRRGLARWSTRPRVVAAERGREFGFIAPDPLGRDFTKWTYRFEVTTSGTEVFESFEMLRDVPLVAQLFERWPWVSRTARRILRTTCVRPSCGSRRSPIESHTTICKRSV